MTTQKKKAKFDYNRPEVRAMVDEIVHGTFMKEGTMVAFPTCFPGASVPIVPDESKITALDIAADGLVYGGTSGKKSHIFVGMFHGVTGVVFDMNPVDGATACPAICCGKQRVFAFVNTPGSGGRILATDLRPLPFDLIQEWGFERPKFDDLGAPVPGEPVVHAVADAAREVVVGVTTSRLFTLDMASGKAQVVAELPGAARLAVTAGGVVGPDGASHLWSFNVGARSLKRKSYELPAGLWGKDPLHWARNPVNGILYTADSDGRLFSFHGDRGFSGPLGTTVVGPVGPMAATFDGRVFGFCGPELAKMFSYDPRHGQVTDLGVAVSVIERRRYGYVFGDAVTGRDGEIVFGENDDFGHVWLYFPKILPA